MVFAKECLEVGVAVGDLDLARNYADAVQMAASIVSGQEDEIATMKDMLSRS